MRFCEHHHQRLTDALRDRELLELCESDSDEFQRKVNVLAHALATDSCVPARDFEPAAYCQMELARHTFRRLGPARCGQSPDGTEQCPICLLNLIHLEVCDDPTCTVDYEAFIDMSAAHAADAWHQIRVS